MGEPDIKKMKAEKDVEGLIKALKDEDLDVRPKAADALGEIGDTRAVAALVHILKGKEEYFHNWNVIKALGKIGDARAAVPLVQALKRED